MNQQATPAVLPTDTKASCELADVFHHYGPAYRASHHLASPQYKAMRAIERCRTIQLGGHLYACNRCGVIDQSYNSCRNRHCPKCQSVAKAEWLAKRQADLLPVEYFHVVFTLPHDLNRLAMLNHKLIYDLLFKAAWSTVRQMGLDPKRLGGDMGMLSILHTWGQNLSQHIHLHCVIPGGALSQDQKKWVSAKPGYLFPVKAMSRLFRGAYVSLLRQAYKDKSIRMEGKLAPIASPKIFSDLLDQLMKKEWVVYCKKPFAGPEQVLKYLGRYTHKIAISNHRILSCKDGKVSFKWRDYSDGNKQKIMTLSADEFIRRFLVHVLPSGFVRIRHFGFLANRCCKNKISIIRRLLTVDELIQETPEDKSSQKTQTVEERIFETTGIDVTACKACGEGKLVYKDIIYTQPRGSPDVK